jgi:Protein of unknown function (DUF2510)
MVGAAAAWYPDPSDPAGLRWWDGYQWTAHTAPPVGAPSAAGGDWALGGASSGWQGGHPGHTDRGPHPNGLNLQAARARGANHYSLITFGVGALYLILAFATHFVLIGFIPLAMAMRAKRSGEALAPLAIAAAVGVILVSLLTLFH